MDERGEHYQDPALIFPGPVALVAGPGSGKTTRLAARIKHFVEDQGANPDEITVITFTGEAARNMQERLTPPAKDGMPDVTLPPEQHPKLICTMHSLGRRIILEHAARLGIGSNAGLLTQWRHRQMLFEDAARLCNEPADFGRECDRRKQTHGVPADERQGRVFGTYRRILDACNVIDYDDQIILACELLHLHDDVREHWQVKARHLLVDEYQDINPPQLELIRLLSEREPSGLFVVGDDDQSIYGFRGADPHYIRDFAEHFGDDARVVPIGDCFRCQPHIIKAAHGFIEAFNPDRIPKPEPVCKRDEGPPVQMHNVPSDAREAEIVASIIDDALDRGDVLVLLPRDDYAEPLKAELVKPRIAFNAPRGRVSDATTIFFALKDWLANPDSNLVLRERLEAVASGDALEIPGPRSRRAEKVAEREEALSKLSALWSEVLDKRKTLRDALRDATATDPMLERLNDVVDDLSRATDGSPMHLAERTLEALKPWANSNRMLDDLAARSMDGPHYDDARMARIMTMRHSKGLEAETVIVLGLEEGAFPSAEPGTAEFEEEARLFYVSMTRAMETLHVFHARTRSGGATRRPQSYRLRPSPFLEGLPKDHREAHYHQSANKRSGKK